MSRRGRTVGRSPQNNTTASEKSLGTMATNDMHFCPILAVAKFPYKYMPENHSATVADSFFSGGKFWERSWDLYWVRSPYYDISKSYVFIRLEQFENLIRDINKAFPGLDLLIPANAEELGLVVVFPDHPELCPQYLGRSSSKLDYENLQSTAPIFDMSSDVIPQRTIKDFKMTMESAIDATKQKNKDYKKEKLHERAVKNQKMGQSFKLCQRYLGLRPRTRFDHEGNRHSSPVFDALDVYMPSPYTFEDDVIFVAVDVEAYERNHNIITEVGIATLDTRDIVNMAPFKNGEMWRPRIRARHFRIKEYAHLKNGDFIEGCPDRFDFGESEFVSLGEAPAAIASCFRHPYSCTFNLNGHDEIYKNPKEKRNIVLLGHDTEQDIIYLRKLGYDVNNLSNLLGKQDTSVMWRAFSRESNPKKLGLILYSLDIEGWNLHNAGNDAVFTMQAMLGLCVKQATEQRGKTENERALERMTTLEARIEEAKKEVEERMREEEWSWHMADLDDGGYPLLDYRLPKKDDAASSSVETLESMETLKATDTSKAKSSSRSRLGRRLSNAFAGLKLSRSNTISSKNSSGEEQWEM